MMYHYKLLKAYRLKYHLSQAQIANRLNVTQSSISKFETGEQVPSIEILIKYCELFHLSMDMLCDIDTKKLDKINAFLSTHSNHEIELMFDFLEFYIQKISKHIL